VTLSQAASGWPPSRYVPISKPGIPSIGLDAEKTGVDERVEHCFANQRVDTAKPLNLKHGEMQARHFEELSTKTFDRLLDRHDERDANAFHRADDLDPNDMPDRGPDSRS
jgi:hypothetical protein